MEIKDRIDYKLTSEAMNQRFEATFFRKNPYKAILSVKMPGGYTKEIKLRFDETNLLSMDPVGTKYVATLFEGYSTETNAYYIAVDVQIGEVVRKRGFLTWVEKVLLARSGLLYEVKQK